MRSSTAPSRDSTPLPTLPVFPRVCGTHLTSLMNPPQHQVEDFLAAAETPDQLEAREPNELRSGLLHEVQPAGALEGQQSNDRRSDHRNPESEYERPSIEIQRGNGGQIQGEHRRFGSSREGGGAAGRRGGFGAAWLVVATFVHEVWLGLQHANILLNPLCQRLDRGYGIALVRTPEFRETFSGDSKWRGWMLACCLYGFQRMGAWCVRYVSTIEMSSNVEGYPLRKLLSEATKNAKTTRCLRREVLVFAAMSARKRSSAGNRRVTHPPRPVIPISVRCGVEPC